MIELKQCPRCGNTVKIGYVCGEYFIMSCNKKDCVCNHFFEMHSSEVQEISAWNEFVRRLPKETAEIIQNK